MLWNDMENYSSRKLISPVSTRKLFISQKLERVYFHNNLPKVQQKYED